MDGRKGEREREREGGGKRQERHLRTRRDIWSNILSLPLSHTPSFSPALHKHDVPDSTSYFSSGTLLRVGETL